MDCCWPGWFKEVEEEEGCEMSQRYINHLEIPLPVVQLAIRKRKGHSLELPICANQLYKEFNF